MGVLIGFVVTFLGASIFNIVGGVPFIPLQTLWVNFTTQVFMSVGLGYGEPADGLMERKPRPSEQPILPRPLFVWLGIYGLVLGATALGIIWGVDDNHGAHVARTMGMTTFAIANLFFAFEMKDELRTAFDPEILADRKLLMFAGLSVLSIVAAVELNVCQRFLKTESLSLRQWLLCIGAASTIVAATEVRKFLLRRKA
jgi:Ca2+-transporting ATPase